MGKNTTRTAMAPGISNKVAIIKAAKLGKIDANAMTTTFFRFLLFQGVAFSGRSKS
jgi:hypothetical protein